MRSKYLLLSLIFGAAWASEQPRQHDAHEHGHATMNLALTGSELVLELESPAMNLVGFEYQPTSDEDKKKVESAASLIQHPEKWITLDTEARCSLEQAHIDSALLEHMEHDKTHVETRDHEEKYEEHHDEEHEEHEEHHADFDISISFHCKNADRLKTVNLQKLFKHFPALEEIEVQWLTDHQQSAAELDAKHPIIYLK